MMFSKIKKAYTLAEVVVVMLIIAVIGSITIKITSNKMQSITAYTYYAAFNTLRTVVGNLIAEAQLAQNAAGTAQATLPSNGTTFCQAFVQNVNTNGDETCNGSSQSEINTANNNNNFAGLTPDVVLKNGIKLYGLSVGYASDMGLSSDPTIIKSEDIYNCAVYRIFADIDGDSGNSTLNDDIYMFYVSLSGKVLPVGEYGHLDYPDDNIPLKVSVQYDDYSSGNRVIKWFDPKSTNFKQAACMSNYIPFTSTYCQAYQLNEATITAHNTCVNVERDCRMMYEKPLRK